MQPGAGESSPMSPLHQYACNDLGGSTAYGIRGRGRSVRGRTSPEGSIIRRRMEALPGKQGERGHVYGTDRGEVAYVEREHLVDLQALGHRDDRGIYGAKGKVRIAVDQRGDSGEVRLGQLDEREHVRLESVEKRGLRCGTTEPGDHVTHFGRDEAGDEELSARIVEALELTDTALMIGIVGDRGGH
jgi:hypothetical protein